MFDRENDVWFGPGNDALSCLCIVLQVETPVLQMPRMQLFVIWSCRQVLRARAAFVSEMFWFYREVGGTSVIL